MKYKNNNQWIIIMGVIIVSLSLILIAKEFSSTQTEQNVETVSRSNSSDTSVEIIKNNIALGDIVITDGKVEARFPFRNTGSEQLVLTAGETSCMCTEAIVERENGEVTSRIKMRGHGSAGNINMVIEPGEEAVLVAIFDPMAHGPNGVGPISRDVYLETNSKTNPELRFSFTGNVIR